MLTAEKTLDLVKIIPMKAANAAFELDDVDLCSFCVHKRSTYKALHYKFVRWFIINEVFSSLDEMMI